MMYKKDFNTWNQKKQQVQNEKNTPFFRERDVFFASLGVNVGFEEDGKGSEFLRPIVVIKKYGKHSLLCAPLTSTDGKSNFRFLLPEMKGKRNSVLLSQLRVIDSRRLKYKLGMVDTKTFQELKEALQKINFG